MDREDTKMITLYNSAKAVISMDRQILMLKKRYEDGRILYTLPGGGQRPGESLDQAVVREVYEETAATVSVSRLISIYEHTRPSRKARGVVKHTVEFLFLCVLGQHYTPAMGAHPDPHQVAVEWIEQDLLASLALYPPALATILTGLPDPGNEIYLGAIPSPL
jgi:ADP-ribose pyrophosphatase YjhB (NUDIX family)